MYLNFFFFLETRINVFKDGTKFSYKICCNLLNKISIITYFENLTVELHVLYALNTHVKFSFSKKKCQILCQSDIIYYMIYKLIFCA